jgi:hypothetical protein
VIDLNTILTQALTAAVEAATKPLIERIEALEVLGVRDYSRLDNAFERITKLESDTNFRLHSVVESFINGYDFSEDIEIAVENFIKNSDFSDLIIDALKDRRFRLE